MIVFVQVLLVVVVLRSQPLFVLVAFVFVCLFCVVFIACCCCFGGCCLMLLVVSQKRGFVSCVRCCCGVLCVCSFLVVVC